MNGSEHYDRWLEETGVGDGRNAETQEERERREREEWDAAHDAEPFDGLG